MGKNLKGENLGPGFYQNPSGMYECRKQVKGIKIQFTNSNFDLLKREAAKREKAIRNSPAEKYKNSTVNEWFHIWFETYKMPYIAKQSIPSMRSKCESIILPYIGKRKLKTITEFDVQKIMKLTTTEKKYATSSIQEALSRMDECFEKAKALGIVNINSFHGAKIRQDQRSVAHKPQRSLTSQEQYLFLKYLKLKESWYYPAFYLMLCSGLRAGEVGGLQWDDINFEKKTITIQRSLVIFYEKGEKHLYLGPTKTMNSNRTIPFMDGIGEVLREWKSQFRTHQHMKELSNSWGLDKEKFGDLVFTTRKGTPLTRYQLEKIIKNYLDNFRNDEEILAAIERREPKQIEKFTPHTLRHTFCSHCIYKGMQPGVVQRLMGHRKLSTTMDIYRHVLEDTFEEEIQKFGNDYTSIHQSFSQTEENDENTSQYTRKEKNFLE